MQRTKTNFTEEAFLLSTFREFTKCWKSSKRSRLSIESSVNGEAFVNFSVFLGNPSETHFNPDAWRRNPSPKENKRKKSSKKIQRDNERAAKFQEKKRQEQAAASSAASGDPPPSTSSQAETSVKAASINFSFASPAAEDLTNDAMEGILSPQPSPENLRHQLEGSPPLNLSDNEEIARDNPTGPYFSFENTTISEENQETASEETESPGLDFLSFKLSQSGLWVRRTTVTIPSLIRENHAGASSENVTTPEEARQENQESAAHFTQEELAQLEYSRLLKEILAIVRSTNAVRS